MPHDTTRPCPSRFAWATWGLCSVVALYVADAATARMTSVDAARAAYVQGDAKRALTSLRALEAELGEQGPAELYWLRSLASLEVGDLATCEVAAEALAARGGSAVAGIRDFLIGNAAFRAGERAEAEATLVEADPTALKLAIDEVRKAMASWSLAVMTRDDWPELRRNLARADNKLAILELKRDEAEAARQTKKERSKKEHEGPRETIEREAKMQEASRLDANALTALLRKVEENEAAKRELRQELRAATAGQVPRDW